MDTNTMKNKELYISQKPFRLLLILGGFFIANTIVAEFIGAKIFSLESTIGANPFNWNLFGVSGSLNFTAGVIVWPIVFIMTDLINEYYGTKGVRMLSLLTAFLISYAFIIVFTAIQLAPADWWISSYANRGIADAQVAYSAIYGQGLRIIAGSIIAFIVAQIVDAFVFHKIKKKTGEKLFWIRATASTFVSQFLDSYVVLYIAFMTGPNPWPFNQYLAVGSVNYVYKILAAIVLLPLLSFVHQLIDNYLGTELATEMKTQAAQD